MLAAARAARASVHPGLRGLRRPLPRDGLEILESEARRVGALGRLALPGRAWLAVMPALVLLAWLLTWAPGRWLEFGLLALLAPAPLLLVPYRWQWLLPALLWPPLMVLAVRALALQPALPAGWWHSPLAAAPCPALLRVEPGQPRAWCVDEDQRAYRFNSRSGFVLNQWPVADAARIFAAASGEAWVQQLPARGLVRLAPGAVAQPVAIRSAVQGAADHTGRLWVIDVGQELWVVEPGAEARQLRAADGLLNNTANVVQVSPAGDVWVGSIGGASLLQAGATLNAPGAWRTLGAPQGAPGAVLNFAFGHDGTAWMLWTPRPGYSPGTDWGVSGLAPNGAWTHLPLGPRTGLDLPRADNPLAVDRHGRVWFVTQSIPLRSRTLGVAAPDLGAAPALYPLSPLPATGPHAYPGGFWRDGYGVIPDGAGGVIVYTGAGQPWLRWVGDLF
jgi:sugar lactone lactonase YvrE